MSLLDMVIATLISDVLTLSIGYALGYRITRRGR